MNCLKQTALLLGLAGVAGVSQAGVSSSWTLTSDYDFRGVTQTAQDPALQGSLDYSHDSGWYIGTWGTNVDFGDDVDIELDFYGGFSKTLDSGIGFDVGLLYYTYPDDSDLNFFEVYGGVSKDWFSGKLWYSPDFGGDSTSGDTPAWYLEANAEFPLPRNFSLTLHAGYSGGDYWDDADSEYFDYAIGLGYTAGNFSLGLKWIDGSDLKVADGTPGDILSSESRVVFTVATTFPWGQ